MSTLLMINPYVQFPAAVLFTLAQDDFTRANSNDSGPNWSGTRFGISNNQLIKNVIDNELTVWQSPLGVEDYSNELTVIANGDGSTWFAVWVRISSPTEVYSTATGYVFFSNGNGSSSAISKYINGVETNLIPSNYGPFTTGGLYAMRLDVTGTLLTAFVNDQQVAQISDSSIATGQFPGITAYGQPVFDNFICRSSSPPGPPTAPAAPINVAGVPGNANVQLSWTPQSNGGSAITDYVIQYSSTGGSSWSTFNDGTSTATNVTVTGLSNGTAYVFRVAAVNAVGQGAFSTTSGSITPVAGSRPTSFSQVGPRFSYLTTQAGGNLAPGTYNRVNFTSSINPNQPGEYILNDCNARLQTQDGMSLYNAGRRVTMNFCNSGGYSENGGFAGFTLNDSYITGGTVAWRPANNNNLTTPTPMTMNRCIVHENGNPSPGAHTEAMQTLGGREHRFNDCVFIANPHNNPDGSTMVTAAVNDGTTSDTDYVNCLFDKGNAFYHLYCGTPSSVSNSATNCIVGTFGNPATYQSLTFAHVYPDNDYLTISP